MAGQSCRLTQRNTIEDALIPKESIKIFCLPVFAPNEYGLMFARFLLDGSITITILPNNQPVYILNAYEHVSQYNAISWSPPFHDLSNGLLPKRLASGGNDKKVKIWK